MGLEFVEAEFQVHRLGVADDVKVVVFEVREGLPVRAGEGGGGDVPLRRHLPVKAGRAGGDLVDSQAGHVPAQDAQGLAHALAGDAAADGEKPAQQAVHGVGVFGAVCHGKRNEARP